MKMQMMFCAIFRGEKEYTYAPDIRVPNYFNIYNPEPFVLLSTGFVLIKSMGKYFWKAI